MRDSPSLGVLLGAMTYEAALLCGVAFAAAAVLVLGARWTYPLPPLERHLLQAWVAGVIGAYLVACWVRQGQTLAQKTWRLRVERDDGRPIGIRTAVLRYLLAWYLVLPGLALASLVATGIVSGALVFAAALLGTCLLARLDREHRLLHDRLLGTRLVRLPKPARAAAS